MTPSLMDQIIGIFLLGMCSGVIPFLAMEMCLDFEVQHDDK
jgi:hypothetical protein